MAADALNAEAHFVAWSGKVREAADTAGRCAECLLVQGLVRNACHWVQCFFLCDAEVVPEVACVAVK